ncbi:MAG: HPP family protein [Desulfuromonadales bacterium]|nr:HPP family protein [Desulfuromonadales bacterium]MDW7757652.1 HPP family protein [Desulfuromonadales bacterium]
MRKSRLQEFRLLRALAGARSPSMPPIFVLWSFVGGTLGILAIHGVTFLVGQPLLIGSFGASAVLLFGAPDSPLTRPRNLIGGHVLSALTAVGVVALAGSSLWSMALAVGLAILVMHITDTVHPPGGATALIGVQTAAGPAFVFMPVLAGVLVLLSVALLTSRLVSFSPRCSEL